MSMCIEFLENILTIDSAIGDQKLIGCPRAPWGPMDELDYFDMVSLPPEII